MFEDEDFEAGNEFISDFLSSLYCRIYLPLSDIVQQGETFPELYLIYKGVVLLCLPSPHPSQFFLLPTYSFFGDYQILMNLKSQINYRSGDTDNTYTMCLKRGRFLKLMEDYPDAKRYYEKRARERRIEFRRVSNACVI